MAGGGEGGNRGPQPRGPGRGHEPRAHGWRTQGEDRRGRKSIGAQTPEGPPTPPQGRTPGRPAGMGARSRRAGHPLGAGSRARPGQRLGRLGGHGQKRGSAHH